ncbi:MAG: endopeptidase La [Muribaculaceae bacterium]|nr:endopeptidase La [Muribaculaceae bacterium]
MKRTMDFQDFDNELHHLGSPTIIAEFRQESITDSLKSIDSEALPILPIRNTIMMPGVTFSVSVNREKSLKLVLDANKKHKAIGVVCQKNRYEENPTAADLYKVGVIATILKVLEMPDGSTTVILQGFNPFELLAIVKDKPYWLGKVQAVDDLMPTPDQEDEFHALTQSLRDITLKVLKGMGTSEPGSQELSFAVRNLSDNPLQLINFVAANLVNDVDTKYQLLEERSIMERCHKLMGVMQMQEQLLQIKNQIEDRTRESITQQQKEHYLQQQMRSIQEELGNSDYEDVIEFEDRAKDKLWSENVDKVFDKELRKLERLNPQTPDYNVQYSYLDTFLNLPWDFYTTDTIDLPKVKKKLDHDHYGLDKVKERILEQLAVIKLRGDMKAPIICLYGPPGVGKTSLGQSIADAMGRKFVRISLGGLHDESEIRGHRRTYVGALPGRILSGLTKCGSSNPVMMLDEIDKIGGMTLHGDPSSALLEVLDPEQNCHFHDNYLDVDYDLSKVLFIATANDVSLIAKPLLDRMELIEISGYTEEEKVNIAIKHLMPKVSEANGFKRRDFTLNSTVAKEVIRNYTRESGVRQLEKSLAKLIRRQAYMKELGQGEIMSNFKKNDVKLLLGEPKYTNDIYEGNEFYGVVTGLAWTSVGGEIMFVESTLIPGKGDKLTLTGNLGQVIKESATLAMQWLKANYESLGINAELFDKNDVHIHFPEGAVPKDGPSAGITLVTSLASTFTKRKVRAKLAMTGEITLRGKVLPVGGIKEKILAAKRAGITDIMLCAENSKDIREIPANFLEGLNFHYVNTISEVLDFGLEKL